MPHARYSFLVILLTLAPWLHAEVHLFGVVTNEQGEPMEMAHIRLAKGSVGTLSNFKGEYDLLVAESDTLRVVFTSLGYRRQERVVNTRNVVADSQGRRRRRLDVQMQVNQSVLGDVEVTTKRQTTRDNFEHLEVENLQHMPSTTGNAVEDMIGTLAGVNMNNELSSQYNVRGGSFDENLVYVNGMEIYRPQLIASGQQEGLSFINPSMVGSVNFSTGGFAASYGDKMSSVLDITYRKPSDYDGEAHIGLTGGSLSVGGSNTHFSQLHGLRYKRSASILNSLDTQGEYDPIFFDYQTYLTYSLGKQQRWEVSFLGNIAINDYRFTPATRETNFGTTSEAHSFKVYFDGWEKDRFDTYFGALTLTCNALHDTHLACMVSAFSTDEEVTYDISGEYWLDQATDVEQAGLGVGRYMQHARNYLDASVVAVTLKGSTSKAGNLFSYGFTYQHEAIEDRISEWERRDSAGYSLPRNASTLRVVENLHAAYEGSSSRLSAYLQDQLNFETRQGGHLHLNAGVRLSHWSFNDEWLFSPRASLRYAFGANHHRTLRLATGLYYQSPFYKEYRQNTTDSEGNTMVVMNHEIRSQRSWQLIAGYDHTFTAMNRPFKFTAEAYYKGISRYIPYTVDNVSIRYLGENCGTAYATGIDCRLYGQFVDGTDSWLSFSLSKSRETYDGLTTPRPTEQRYGIGLFFSDYYPGHNDWRIFLRGVFNDGLPFYSPEGGRASGIFRTPAYKRVDLGASHLWDARKYRFMRRGVWRKVHEMSLGLDFFNLLDIDNTNSYYWLTVVGGGENSGMSYAVPNYLTGRTFNISFGLKFGKQKQ